MSEDKVRTKDSCWSVETIYDPRELPGVSTAGPGIGQGVTRCEHLHPCLSSSYRSICTLWV
jgi:hypothetical protein